MNENLNHILSHKATVPVVVGVTAFVGGLGLGYFLGEKKPFERRPKLARVEYLVKDIREEHKTEVEELEEVDEISEKFDPAEPVFYPKAKPDPSTIVVDLELKHNLDELVDKYGVQDGHRIFRQEVHGFDDTEDDQEPKMMNVFAGSSDDWDYELEVNSRTDSEPFVLHKDEFWENEEDLPQTTLTYFVGDDIMVDQDEKPIYNYTNVVGELKFGHGSQDPNVFHVRNPRLKVEYEILRDSGSYAVEVLGLDSSSSELEPKLTKFKPDD
jgi:hypothetical protein